jgi:putative ABC transport system substrate-binding protein
LLLGLWRCWQGASLVYHIHSRLVMFHHAATGADKIVKGTKPDDLPVEQPSKFELVVK